MLALEHTGDDEFKKRYLVYYADEDVAEMWNSIPKVKDANSTFDQVVEAIQQFYPELSPSQRYTISEFERFIEDFGRKGVSSREEFAEYRRGFSVRSEYLVSQNKLSGLDVDRYFMRAITGRLRDALMDRLRIKLPDHEEGTPYPVADLVKNTEFILGGSAFGSSELFSSPSTSPTDQKLKKEDVNLMAIAEALRNMQTRMDTIASGRGPRSAGSAPAGPRPDGCLACGGKDHFARNCPKVAEYQQAGKCARSADGRITLPNGTFVPRSTPGTTILERVDNYLKAQPSASVNFLSFRSTPPPKSTTPTPTPFYSTALDSTSSHSAYVEDVSDDEVGLSYAEQVLANNAAPRKKPGEKRVQFDGVEIPVRGPAKLPQSTAAPKSKQPPSALPPADTGDRTEPQYRYQAMIEDPALLQQVLEKSLNATFEISNKQLLATCPPARKQYRELVTSKRVPVNSLEPAEPEVLAVEPAPVLHTYCPRPPPSTAAELLPIRSVSAIVQDQFDVECLLDQGAVVCLIREDMWARLALEIDVNNTMSLEAANTGQVQTMGVIKGVKFRIAGINLSLHAHVVQNCPFEILLGRPFFALTECETKDFKSGDQHITITDPDDESQRRKIATSVRGYLGQHPYCPGFQESMN